MCDLKSDLRFNCDGLVLDSGSGEFKVKGRIEDPEYKNVNIQWWAANPPNYLTSFSGSGLPYPNPETAYDNTQNQGIVKTDDEGNFEFNVFYPNSYYYGLGTYVIEPCCHIKLCNNESAPTHTIKLGNGIPFRMLTYPPLNYTHRARQNVMFYNGREQLPIRSQEKILRDSKYPNKNIMPTDFWGLKPSHP